MTLRELWEGVLGLLPLATIEEDNDGQIVIFTGLKQVSPKEDDELEVIK